MPYPRNPFFTGREDVLKQLRDALTAGRSAALTQPQAISGLGGIGKTQTAVEYAYRHQDEYQAVLWMSAVDETTLREGFVEAARLLELPQAQEADQGLAVQAVKAWLEREAGWLLILDNADDLSALKPFLPPQMKGHVLMTTRASATGALAQKVEIGRLSEDDGALLLLRRAKLVGEKSPLDTAAPADLEAALALSRAVDGLPLALDQAGAFIEETASTPARYLELYQTEAAELLAEYGDPEDRDHASVHVTFSLAFAKVAAISPAAGELMRCCAFLAPDAIPEEVFIEGDAALNVGADLFGVKGLAWEKIVGAACRYSLLSREGGVKTLSIHRLVQTVIRHAMEETQRRSSAERAVGALYSVFPRFEHWQWPLCARLLPHAQACAHWIKVMGIKYPDAGKLLNNAGGCLTERAQYTEAEQMLTQALKIHREAPGGDESHIAWSLDSLAELYRSQRKYREAAPFYTEALHTRERKLGLNHRNLAWSLNGLATCRLNEKCYDEAEALYKRALAIQRGSEKPYHNQIAWSLDGLAHLFLTQEKYQDAEAFYREALSEAQKKDHPEFSQDVAAISTNLAKLLSIDSYNQGRSQVSRENNYRQAEQLFQSALNIRQSTVGPGHPYMVATAKSYASFLRKRGRQEEAEELEAVYVKS